MFDKKGTWVWVEEEFPRNGFHRTLPRLVCLETEVEIFYNRAGCINMYKISEGRETRTILCEVSNELKASDVLRQLIKTTRAKHIVGVTFDRPAKR